jgi:phage baseplate assembly protein W
MANINQIPRYVDLDLGFTPHPVTKDLLKKTGDQAVIASVRHIVLSGFYERPFHPELGCGVKQLLFENVTPITAQYIKRAIEEAINNFEPRVNLRNVIVTAITDSNTFNVDIEFYIVNRADPTRITLFLERVR